MPNLSMLVSWLFLTLRRNETQSNDNFEKDVANVWSAEAAQDVLTYVRNMYT